MLNRNGFGRRDLSRLFTWKRDFLSGIARTFQGRCTVGFADKWFLLSFDLVLSYNLLLAIRFLCRQFSMMPDSSAGSTSADSIDGISVGSNATSTAATSPVFSTRHGSILETLGNFTDLGLASESPHHGARQRLPDMLDPATAAGIEVRNVCFVGAGYVGESENEICAGRGICL